MYSDEKLNLIWEFLTDNQIATNEEIELVVHIAGYTEENLNAIIYARTAFHSVKQLYECEPENYYFCEDIIENIEEFD